MLSQIKRRFFSKQSDTAKLLEEAAAFERFKPHHIKYRNMHFEVSDFISVAWQLKEFFDDGRMNFKATSPSPLIYDCGANVGVSVIYYKQLYPLAKIKAFEPDPKIVACLKNNLVQNNVHDVELIEKAVWNSDAGVQFGSEGADGGSIFHEGNKISLPSIRLKSLLEKESKIDLLKMDIEGAEFDVLKDCADELSKIDHLFVEYHSWTDQNQQLDKLLKLLTDAGFRYYIHSIGETLKQPFIDQKFSNGMDIQLDIHAIRRHD